MVGTMQLPIVNYSGTMFWKKHRMLNLVDYTNTSEQFCQRSHQAPCTVSSIACMCYQCKTTHQTLMFYQAVLWTTRWRCQHNPSPKHPQTRVVGCGYQAAMEGNALFPEFSRVYISYHSPKTPTTCTSVLHT